MKLRIAILVALVIAVVILTSGPDFRAKVVKVIDGDTVVAHTLFFEYHIRLSEIDAPEKHQSFGKKSTERLKEKIQGRVVYIKPKKDQNDPHQRVLGEIYVYGRSINLEMVREGMAWQYKKYSKSKEYSEAEDEARRSKSGLWKEKNPIPPWEYRKSRNGQLSQFFNCNKSCKGESFAFAWTRTTTSAV